MTFVVALAIVVSVLVGMALVWYAMGAIYSWLNDL